MADHPPALRHGELREVLPDTFFVAGEVKLPGPVRFSRNMTVIRQGGELVIVNSMRLDEAGLAKLEKLGKVTHVLRIAGFHGRDDAFYKSRYGARVSCVRGQAYVRGFGPPKKPEDHYFKADAELEAGSPLPVEGARLHVFASKPPEALLVWERHGGTLVSGDALQNWGEPDEFFSWPGKVMMRMMGFIRAHNVGPGWLKQAKPPAADLRAMLELPFANVLPSHGAPVLGNARERFRERIEHAVAARAKT
jgi:hypothetical protein